MPTSVKVELLADSGIMQMSDPLTMSAITPIDDLGITDTDAGSAIWE